MSYSHDPGQPGWPTNDPNAGYNGSGYNGVGGPVPGGPIPGGYGAMNPAPGTTEKNGVGLWSMILGLIGLILWPAGIAATVLGFVGLRNLGRQRATNRGQTIAGLILGIATTVIGVIVTIILVVVLVIGLGAAAQEGSGDGDGGEAAAAPSQQAAPDQATPEQQAPSDGPLNAAGQGEKLADGVNMSLSIEGTGVASKTAAPDKKRGQQFAYVQITIENRSAKDFTAPKPLITCTYGGGATCEEVFDTKASKHIDGTSNGFETSVPAGKKLIFMSAFSIPRAQLNTLKMTFEFAFHYGDRRTLEFAVNS